MSGVATDTTDDVGRVIALLGTVVLAVTDFTTILAGLVFIITESTVECRKFTQLATLELVLTFGDGSSLQ